MLHWPEGILSVACSYWITTSSVRTNASAEACLSLVVPGFLTAQRNRCVSWQQSNTAVEALAPLQKQVPICTCEDREMEFPLIYLFIHEKAQTRTNLTEHLSLFHGCSWMNKQKQREISCPGRTPECILGVSGHHLGIDFNNPAPRIAFIFLDLFTKGYLTCLSK